MIPREKSRKIELVKRKPPKFESRVVLDGSQTRDDVLVDIQLFESRVVLDGSQTLSLTPRQ